MNAGTAIAWGTPEATFTVRLTMTPIASNALQRIEATTHGRLTTDGALCLANYTSITMCAQFEDCEFPQLEDLVFELRPGSYDVEIARLFTHVDGEQFSTAELPSGDHYVVVFTPVDPSTPAPRARKIAWALTP